MRVGKTRSARDIDRRKQRVRGNIVERNTVVAGASQVDKIDRTQEVKNDMFSSYNFLMASDQFYDKLKNLKREYEDFYHKEQELEEAIRNLEYDDSIIENMGILVEKYNSAIEALEEFDSDFGTNHYRKIISIVDEFRIQLFSIGIIRGSNDNLIYDREKFKEKLQDSENAFRFIFEPAKGLIIRLYRAFRNIKVSDDEENFHDKYRKKRDYEGMMLDQKG